MTTEEIINLIKEDYMSCLNVSESEGKIYCYVWWKHDDCERIRELLFKITGDVRYMRLLHSGSA